jgi:hypothetical protein
MEKIVRDLLSLFSQRSILISLEFRDCMVGQPEFVRPLGSDDAKSPIHSSKSATGIETCLSRVVGGEEQIGSWGFGGLARQG